ncbi:MAG: colicin E5-related ribonuclease [Pseudonocardiaceae bacterium]
MTRQCRVALASVIMLLVAAPPAYADNCSSLSDCYGSVRSASGAAAAMALLIGLLVFIAPALLQGTVPQPPQPPPPSPPPLLPLPLRPLKRDEEQQPSGAEVPGVADRPIRYDEKALANMATRGWSRDTVEQTARSPHSLRAMRDTRFNVDGSHDDQPATAFFRPDGWYVVLSDRLHDVVQVSAGRMDGWTPVRLSGHESFAARVAAGTGVSTVLAGTEPCYPIAEMNRVLEYCETHSIRVLGLEGFTGDPGRLTPRMDMILDCSAERNADGRPATIDQCASRARQLVHAWSTQPDCFVSITMR